MHKVGQINKISINDMPNITIALEFMHLVSRGFVYVRVCEMSGRLSIDISDFNCQISPSIPFRKIFGFLLRKALSRALKALRKNFRELVSKICCSNISQPLKTSESKEVAT